MDTTVKGIVLKTKDYKESDKLLTILTLEKGKILVKARGVKKPKSKLKAFCQSFCFADFELINSNNMYILSGVNEIENFYPLICDIDKYSYAFCVLEILDKICVENQQYVGIFIEALKCLKQMLDNTNVKLCLIKYILGLLSFEGFKINVDRCPNCKSVLMGDIYLDLSRGEVLCKSCKTFDCVELEKSVFSTIKIICDCDYEKLSTIKINETILNKTLNLLIKNLDFKYEIKLKSLNI